MKILITGIAGFIAFNFAKELCKNKNLKVVGVDNFSEYYSVKLKKKRVQNLKKFKNFRFIKLDLIEKKIYQIFRKEKFDEVYNFAAQAEFVIQWKIQQSILIQMYAVLVIL